MKTPESRSGLRIARFWKTKASISMPAPATAQAISEPRMPVATPKRAGSENTPGADHAADHHRGQRGDAHLGDGAAAGAASVCVLMRFSSSLDRVGLLDPEAGEAVQHAQRRAGVAEDGVRQVEQRGDAERGAHERAARVPRDQRRGHRAAVGGQPGQVGRGEAAPRELGPEDPGRQHQRDVLVAGHHVEAEGAGEDGQEQPPGATSRARSSGRPAGRSGRTPRASRRR